MSEWRIYPAFLDWPEAVTDVATVSPTVVKLRLVSGATGFDQMSRLSELSDLWCFDINAERLARICSCQKIRRLFIEGLKVTNLNCLTKLNSLEVLSLESCSAIQNLAGVAMHTELKGLGITNFKNVHSVKEISALTQLKHLAIAGGMWTRMNIDSLEPLSRLLELEDLDLSNTKVSDESLRPLGSLKKLRFLNLPNFYPMEEFAWLSGKLKETKRTWFKPFIEFSHSACKKCRRQTMVMLTGKRKPMHCTECDKNRLDKHVEAFSRFAN